MSYFRRCSRTACGRAAVATLTYVYADSTAVVGPLATYSEPHSYDLCEEHAVRLSTPKGWELVRHEGEFSPAPPNPDALEALADAVRRAGRAAEAPAPDAALPQSRREDSPVAVVEPPETRGGRRHLRSVPE